MAPDTPKPPQSHSTNGFPTYGKAENKLVITVAPQKLIWPQGRRYPINAVAMVKINMVMPRFHVAGECL